MTPMADRLICVPCHPSRYNFAVILSEDAKKGRSSHAIRQMLQARKWAKEKDASFLIYHRRVWRRALPFQ